MLLSTLRQLLACGSDRLHSSHVPARRRSASRRKNRFQQAAESLESRAVLAVSFSFIYPVSGSIGFNDPTTGASYRQALERTATMVGTWFNYTANVSIDVQNDNDNSSGTLATMSSSAASDVDGFNNQTVVGKKILTNGAVDANGAAADASLTVNFANQWELASSFSANEQDFTATIVHELTHAIGFAANIEFDGSNVFGSNPKGWSVFDQFVSNELSQPAIDPTSLAINPVVWNTVRTNGSAKLSFNGPNAKAANGGLPVRLFAPTSFNIGDSVSHVDDTVFSYKNYVMVSAGIPGERNARIYNPIEFAMIKDLGFDVIQPGINVASTGGSNTVNDSGAVSDTLVVSLKTMPDSNVVVNILSANTGEVTTSVSQLTFTPANWNTPQTVTLNGVSDHSYDGNKSTNVTFSIVAAQSDPGYATAANQTAPVTSIDDDGPPAIIVTTLLDEDDPTPANGAGISLREAIRLANITPETDLIQFQSGLTGTITFQAGHGALLIDSPVTIRGNGADRLTVNANNLSRVFEIMALPGSVTISDLSIQGGNAGTNDGGGIQSDADLTLERVNLHDNFARSGAGLYQRTGNLIVRSSAIYNNIAQVSGGGLLLSGASAKLTQVTIANNQAQQSNGKGGGIELTTNTAGNTVIHQSTITGNTVGAAGQGAGIDGPTTHGYTLNNSILVANLLQGATESNINNGAVVAANLSFNNLIGFGFNGGMTDGVNGIRIRSGDFFLGTLGNYGGPTLTIPVLPGSPALDWASDAKLVDAATADALTTDARGLPRKIGPLADLGAFEQLQADWGDLPDAVSPAKYPTLAIHNGAAHYIVVGGPVLGTLIDGETDGQPDPTAGLGTTGGDDHLGVDDEDGVTLVATPLATNAGVTKASVIVTASKAALIDAWIDFDQNGQFDNVTERLGSGSVPVVAGKNVLTFDIPANALKGQTGVRVRISSAGGLTSTGVAADGEVEDYMVTLLNGDDSAKPVINVTAPDGNVSISVVAGNVVVKQGDLILFQAPAGTLSRLNLTTTKPGTDVVTIGNLFSGYSGKLFVNGVEIAPPSLGQRMYRAYNPNADYHFFTLSKAEFDNAIAAGYRDESTDRAGFAVLPDQPTGSSAVYRLYNLQTGRHYYTINASERDGLVAIIPPPANGPDTRTVGWRFEKIEGYIYPNAEPGMVELYRLYNSNSGVHLYTQDPAVRDQVLAIPGEPGKPNPWQLHSTLGFAFAISAGGTVGSTTAPLFASEFSIAPLLAPSANDASTTSGIAPLTTSVTTDSISRLIAVTGVAGSSSSTDDQVTDAAAVRADAVTVPAGTDEEDAETSAEESLDAVFVTLGDDLLAD